MAPEVRTGRFTTKADLYSYGITIVSISQGSQVLCGHAAVILVRSIWACASMGPGWTDYCNYASRSIHKRASV